MSLLQQIRADLDQARKDKNQFVLTILTTVYSEAAMVGKTKRNAESTDEEVLSVVRKFKLGVEEIEKFKGSTAESFQEIRIYEKYLPQMLTADQLTAAIQDIIEHLPERSPKQMGVVMAKLKNEFLGRYDGTFASQTVKQLLTS
jgi:uncharacterized protein YqeY